MSVSKNQGTYLRSIICNTEWYTDLQETAQSVLNKKNHIIIEAQNC